MPSAESTPSSRAVVATAGLLGVPADLVGRVIKQYTEALARERRVEERDERKRIVSGARRDDEQRRREGKGGAAAPTPERTARGDLVDGEVYVPGSDQRTVKTRVAQDPIEAYAAKGIITPRQTSAAKTLQQDYELGIIGARDPEAGRGSGPAGGGFSQAQLEAGEAYARAIQGVGPIFAPIVVAVCCLGQNISEFVRRGSNGKRAGRARVVLTYQLRCGLDRLGDALGLQTELVEETVFDGEARVRVQYRHEATGRVSAIFYGAQMWIAEAKDVGELKAAARRKLAGEG